MINSKGYLREASSGTDLVQRRYLVFAGEAEKAGFPEIARLFRATVQDYQENSRPISA